MTKIKKKIRKEPVNKTLWGAFVDLGRDTKCLKCGSRYCACKERLDGTWETDLPTVAYVRRNNDKEY